MPPLPLPQSLALPPALVAVLQRRGVQSQEELQSLLQPDPAPEAKAHFPDLEIAVQRLLQACREGQALAVCGDYDADGMTSTALLVGVLSRLGAKPQAAIPSRQSEGYGLNAAMVERLAEQGVKLLVTVDNGISAREALERAEGLGLEVIVTDHHTIPPQRPPLLALLHPALTPPSSPYRGLAGVGLAYVLAAAVAERLRNPQALRTALDLFCIGTIADMAPLTGVNRRWLQEGLPQLHRSLLPGLRALAELAGLEDRPIDSQGVGFRLAPRLNAVGRLADPQLAVELLTTADADRALELAERCEQLNRQRRELCDGIEAEANALVEADGDQRPAFLLLAQNHWHHGVIGIVAARLVERWGLPVALLAGEGNGRLRSSVRAPEGFAVDAALQACADLLERFGGHPAAGGFTVQATQVAALHERLNGLANDWLAGREHALVVRPEALLPLEQIDRDFLQQLRRLEPFGAANPSPLFWARHCKVKRQRLLRGGHLLLELAVPTGSLSAIAWRWSGPEPSSPTLDLAFRLKEDHWQGQPRLQLELEALRPALHERVTLWRRQRCYQCERQGDALVIRNPEGRELRCQWPQTPGDNSDPVQSHPDTAELVQHAALALGFVA
ncbi:MAG TPA: single-stranded-DNA-specific exonuclease RecJ [Synechococcales bacterium UBA12195]|nr:MAG: single-stranded-DNA-specific exonuclease RecJ [Synechococcus sp. MED-G67]HCA62317.1 single-stranded-DNA-specific exonuclease RecJ [Synechococcales bacterium UBA8647]HCV57261.1 single-stranded-DNA-specific exonuclease RecJ [Synechococcales bacterium UBA12195]